MELRPLGFGEIFDRAVTLYIRNFVPFASLVLVLVVPEAVFQYFYAKGSQPQFDAMIRVFQHPESASNAHVPTVFDSPLAMVALGAMLIFAWILWPFALNACAVGVGRLYRNRPVEFSACYAPVMRHWLSICGMMIWQFLVFLGWYIGAILIVVLIVVGVMLFRAISTAFAFWVGFAGALIGFALALPVLAPLFVAMTFAMYAVVIEERDIMSALSLGFRRVFNRQEFWRAMLFAIAAGAVVLGGNMVLSFLSLLAAFLHQPAIEVVIQSLSQAALAPFAVVLLAIYYFDVRIRHEGYDLESSLDTLVGASAT